MLRGKNIVLGVTGGIAAYKAANVASLIKKLGAEVHVVMTASAKEFIAPETFRAITGNRVYTSVFDESERGVLHIDLARNADAVLVAPATANFIAKAASGIADDMLSAILLAANEKKIIIAPAMNCHMYENAVVQENLKRLIGRGFVVVEPEEGMLACGEEGKGRLPEAETIVNALFNEIAFEKCLTGKKVLVTAGATVEAIDPVRFISNHSTGKMGCAVAKAALLMGADVVLVAGKMSVDAPKGAELVKAISAKEMYDAVTARFEDSDVVIMTAAVADYRPKVKSAEKIKKADDAITLELEKTDDILKELGRRKKDQVLVGFCMETENLLERAKDKLKRKNLDLICANSLKEDGAGFGADTNILHIFEKDGGEEHLPLDTKENLAKHIMKKVAEVLN